MQLTIGIPTYDDSGLAYTVEDLLTHHRSDLADCEILILDNNPAGVIGKQVADWHKGWLAGLQNPTVRYEPYAEVQGTAPAKNEAFRRAKGDAVVVIDSHVFFLPGVIGRLKAFFARHQGATGLFHGPLVYDNTTSISTHQDDVWRGGNWGTWATDDRGLDPDAPMFAIPAAGTGLIASWRTAWLGFPGGMKGFGGEEVVIHLTYHQQRRMVWCLPFLRWWHKFRGPSPVPYPMRAQDKIRNYLVAAKVLGIESIAKRAHDHFCNGSEGGLGNHSKIPEAEFQLYAKQAEDIYVSLPDAAKQAAKKGCTGCGHKAATPSPVPPPVPVPIPVPPPPDPTLALGVLTLEELYQFRLANPGADGMAPFAARLRELASQSQTVVVLGRYAGCSTLALLAGQPERIVSIEFRPQLNWDALLASKAGKTALELRQGDSRSADIPECDLLLIDAQHTADAVWSELVRHAPNVRHWIALHDTVVLGENGHNGRPGILPAVRRYLRENPEWSVVEARDDAPGMIYLSRDPADKPALPAVPRQMWNFGKAWLTRITAGSPNVDEATFDGRLAVCSLCIHRCENRCSACGCYLDELPTGAPGKAAWATETCPVGLWADSASVALADAWKPFTRSNLGNSPKVAWISPTWRRPISLTNNLLACFEAQDYPNRELIIFDDAGFLPEQSGDRWRIVSVKERFESLVAKYRALFDLTDAPLLLMADDDDAFAPWHTSAHVAALRQGFAWSRPSTIWTTSGGLRLYSDVRGLYVNASCIRREFLAYMRDNESGIKPETDTAGRLEVYAPEGDPCKYGKPSFCYRWSNTGTYHASGRAFGEKWRAMPDQIPMPERAEIRPEYDAETREILAKMAAG